MLNVYNAAMLYIQGNSVNTESKMFSESGLKKARKNWKCSGREHKNTEPCLIICPCAMASLFVLAVLWQSSAWRWRTDTINRSNQCCMKKLEGRQLLRCASLSERCPTTTYSKVSRGSERRKQLFVAHLSARICLRIPNTTISLHFSATGPFIFPLCVHTQR